MLSRVLKFASVTYICVWGKNEGCVKEILFFCSAEVAGSTRHDRFQETSFDLTTVFKEILTAALQSKNILILFTQNISNNSLYLLFLTLV